MASLRDLVISNRRTLSGRLLSVRYSRASGPGGQHVNKTETKADLRLDLSGTEDVLRPFELRRLREQLASRILDDGSLRVVVDEHREQSRNLEVAIERMESLIRGAIVPPKKRRPTKPTRGSKERRLSAKRQNSERKRSRQVRSDD